MNVWSCAMHGLTSSSGMNKLLSTYTETYPANHHKACGGRRKQTLGYKRQVLKKRSPTMRARDATPCMASRSMDSMGNVDINNKKVQRTIFGLVLARTRICITFLGRVEGRVVSRRSPVSVCRITEESCVRVCMSEVLSRHQKSGHTLLMRRRTNARSNALSCPPCSLRSKGRAAANSQRYWSKKDRLPRCSGLSPHRLW